MAKTAFTALVVVHTLLGAGCSWSSPGDSQPDQDQLRRLAGRIVDPYGLDPEDAVLRVGSIRQAGSFSSWPVAVAADGRFRTSGLRPGTYVLQLLRTPHSQTKRETLVSLQVVPVESDVTDVTLTVQPDMSLAGSFRMDSDNPRARWPPHIVVHAFLVVDGTRVPVGRPADGAAGGRFVLRNPIGPRVVRTGYTLEPDHPWWPSQVLLDGRDVTNVPTDFSRHEGSKLEVVFTQHPARIAGTVEDANGRILPRAWIVACSAEASTCEPWRTTSHAIRADAEGAFRFTTLPGRYRVSVFGPREFSSTADALRELGPLASDGTLVELRDREVERLRLVVR